MKPMWVIQKNLMKPDEYAAYLEAFKKLDIHYRAIKAVPFSKKVPNIKVENPVIAWGTTTLIKNVLKSNWKPGVFYTPDNFTLQKWKAHYGNYLLNEDAEIMRFGDVPTKCQLDEFFIRPNSDLKDFSGQVISKDKFNDWYDQISHGGFTFSKDSEVYVCKPRHIKKEWRIFIVGGKAVAASQYSIEGRLCVDPFVPTYAIHFAEVAASWWSPEPAFVMDICLSGGRPLIVELNCINGSGTYKANIFNIVEAMSSLVEKMGDKY